MMDSLQAEEDIDEEEIERAHWEFEHAQLDQEERLQQEHSYNDDSAESMGNNDAPLDQAARLKQTVEEFRAQRQLRHEPTHQSSEHDTPAAGTKDTLKQRSYEDDDIVDYPAGFGGPDVHGARTKVNKQSMPIQSAPYNANQKRRRVYHKLERQANSAYESRSTGSQRQYQNFRSEQGNHQLKPPLPTPETAKYAARSLSQPSSSSYAHLSYTHQDILDVQAPSRPRSSVQQPSALNNPQFTAGHVNEASVVIRKRQSPTLQEQHAPTDDLEEQVPNPQLPTPETAPYSARSMSQPPTDSFSYAHLTYTHQDIQDAKKEAPTPRRPPMSGGKSTVLQPSTLNDPQFNLGNINQHFHGQQPEEARDHHRKNPRAPVRMSDYRTDLEALPNCNDIPQQQQKQQQQQQQVQMLNNASFHPEKYNQQKQKEIDMKTYKPPPKLWKVLGNDQNRRS